MDASEATKLVYDKISRLEPDHVAKKIIGYIYFQGLSDQDMIRLALGPESLIHSLIQNAKTARLLASTPPISPTLNPSPLSDTSIQYNAFSPASPRPIPAPSVFRRMDGYWDPQTLHNSSFKMGPYSDYLEDPLEAARLGPAGGYPIDLYCPEAEFSNLSIKGSRNSLGMIGYPVKTCHYFSKGFCKHGSNCRYFHGEPFAESYPHMFGSNPYEVAGDDQVFLPGSLEKLELEIVELLKSRRGNPLSIASLPMMYYEKYGRTLQAEGYLTESQRHGKAGYSLTKLLARLRNSIRLIDRPHGQHAVILSEDIPKYMDIRCERNELRHIVNGSRQIYLTFPAESSFSEEDVSNYFSSYGPVQDVRIPCQQKRMFGFVTFENADTVKLVLSKGNPHFVCNARVLVKPYREKSKLMERKYMERFDLPVYYNSHPMDFDSELQASWESSRLFGRHEQAVELETTRLSQLQLGCKATASQPFFNASLEKFKLPEDHPRFPSAERVNYLLDVLSSSSTSYDNAKYPSNTCGDQESAQGLNLPDSPFASAVPSSVSAVI